MFMLLTAAAHAGDFPDSWSWDVDDAKMRAEHAALVGKPMPALTVSGWFNGEVKPADMKGKVVVVELFATWCEPCIEGIPHNNALMAKYQKDGLIVLGVCTTKGGQDKLAQTVKDHDIKYPTAADPTLATQKDWHVLYYPTFAVVDRNGILRALGVAPEHVEDVVKKLLAEKSQS